MRLTQPIHVLKRRARLLSRELGIPLHDALDRLASDEGYRSWAHLSAQSAAPYSARELLAQFVPGDLVLLAARPRQGKTVLGLALVAQALEAGRAAAFFSLECTERDVDTWLTTADLNEPSVRTRLTIDTSDDITAARIIQRSRDAARGSLLVVDYLQLLDRRRTDPALGDQLAALRAFTAERGHITVCLSQVTRAFEQSGRTIPGFADVHLPNPLPRDVFTKGCFLHRGRMRLERWS